MKYVESLREVLTNQVCLPEDDALLWCLLVGEAKRQEMKGILFAISKVLHNAADNLYCAVYRLRAMGDTLLRQRTQG